MLIAEQKYFLIYSTGVTISLWLDVTDEQKWVRPLIWFKIIDYCIVQQKNRKRDTPSQELFYKIYRLGFGALFPKSINVCRFMVEICFSSLWMLRLFIDSIWRLLMILIQTRNEVSMYFKYIRQIGSVFANIRKNILRTLVHSTTMLGGEHKSPNCPSIRIYSYF